MLKPTCATKCSILHIYPQLPTVTAPKGLGEIEATASRLGETEPMTLGSGETKPVTLGSGEMEPATKGRARRSP